MTEAKEYRQNADTVIFNQIITQITEASNSGKYELRIDGTIPQGVQVLLEGLGFSVSNSGLDNNDSDTDIDWVGV